MLLRSLAHGLLAVLLLLASPHLALATLIDFDDVTGGVLIGDPTGIHPGNQYAARGVLFRSGSLSGSVSVGSTVTLTSPVDEFEVLNVPISAISDPNLAVARGGGLNDLLMIFTTPVTSVSLTSDEFPGEFADIIRLMALAPTANVDEFTVLAFDEKLDDAVSAPDNLLSVALGGTPFSYALFQVTTEAEGFDNLNFSPVRGVPEPPVLTLAGIGAVVLTLSRRRRTLNGERGPCWGV